MGVQGAQPIKTAVAGPGSARKKLAEIALGVKINLTPPFIFY
jgi:hypothetical protein